jgi:hypothetical protein
LVRETIDGDSPLAQRLLPVAQQRRVEVLRITREPALISTVTAGQELTTQLTSLVARQSMIARRVTSVISFFHHMRSAGRLRQYRV